MEYLSDFFEFAKERPGISLLFVGVFLLTKAHKYNSNKYASNIKDMLNRPVEVIELLLIIFFIAIGTLSFVGLI